MRKYRVIELAGVLLGIASFLLTFVIVPPLFLAPLGIIFNIITIKKNNDKKLGIIGLILCIIPLVIIGSLFWFLRDLQVGP